MPKREKTQIVQFKLRIREELRAKLEKAAKASGISINSEMERRLEASFTPAAPVPTDQLRAIVQDAIKDANFLKTLLEKKK